jgi:eukaryotic-like serine/threonine-protein kinase
MPDDPRIQEILDHLVDSDSTPEEACQAYPELLAEVRERWERVCRVDAELDAMFPTVRALDADPLTPPPESTVLPQIPGYEIEEILGRGGMGIVFRARHLRLNRVIALKMGLSGTYAGPQERQRFRREAEAVAALRHPNVVQVHDVGEADGRPYFAMEYVEGGSLAQKLAGTPLPAHEAAALLMTIAGAVGAAHRAGVVHRDLKPANVLLTADGTPKISDFGLAYRLTDEAGLTRTGTVLGTPSYMAPEQARGDRGAAGPAVDVYALGAMLYECLTGGPPFRAETGLATIGQVLSQDPVPPSRLNSKVPRDLETVCLKCLRKEPQRRYATAAELADDLGRFLRGETTAARPEGLLARLLRRIRRRPVPTAAIAVATLSVIFLTVGGVWTLSERAAVKWAAAADQEAVERAVDEDLRDMSGSLKKASWPEARAALGRAKARLGDRRSEELCRRIARGEREFDLAARLEAVRLERAVRSDNWPDWKESAAAYETVFREAGLAQPFEDQGVVVDRIVGLDIRATVTDALDDWARCEFLNEPAFIWLSTIASRVDPDLSDWRSKARTVRPRPNAAELADAGLRAGRCDPLLIGLGRNFTFHFKDPIPFLTKVQQAHSGDLFANLELAEQLVWRNRQAEAVRYYQAALAIRPGAPAVSAKLGLVLGQLGRNDEAVEYHWRAVSLAAASAEFRRNLVLGLLAVHRNNEALEQARLALREIPETARSRAAVWEGGLEVPAKARLLATLGDALAAAGKHSDAAAEYQQALALEPALREALTPLREVLIRLERFEDLRAAWKSALDHRSGGHNAHYGYAELCLFLGREDEYRAARRALLRAYVNYHDPVVAERTGRACLLLPATGEELLQAAALADRAAALDRVKAKWNYPHYQFAGGLADYRRGRYDRAATTMRGDASGVLGPAPRLVLAMALYRADREAEARRTLAMAVLGHDWRVSQVKDQDGWIYHSLRREAESMMLPNMRDFLEGKHWPQDKHERGALLGVCQFTNRTVALARLYADVFVDDPSLASDIRAGHRYRAACAAAQAGCGRGLDATQLKETDQKRWRAQAKKWLREDLTAFSKTPQEDTTKNRDWIKNKLAEWKNDRDVAGIRDPAELNKLSAQERQDCLALWREVGAMLDRAK